MVEKGRGSSLAGLAGALVASAAFAQAPEAENSPGGAVEAKVLGERVLVRAAMQTETWHKETHVVIDFARSTALELHRNAIRSLTWGEGEQTLKIVADGFRIEVPRDGVILEIGDLLEAITARHDNELEQIDVAAILGWPVLRHYAMRLSLSEGELALRPGGTVDIEEVRQSASTFVSGVLTFDDRVLVPVNHDAGKAAYMQFNTAGYHTCIDLPAASARGRPSGDIDDLFFGASGKSERISGMVAFLPLDFKAEREAEYLAAKRREDEVRAQVEARGIEMPPHLVAKPIVEFDGDVLLRSGLNLLAAYDLEINPVQGYLALTRMVDSSYSDADFQFYSAASARDVSALRRYARTHPADRNIEEAAQLMFDLGVENGASIAEQMEAIGYGLGVIQERGKMVYVAGFAKALAKPGFADGHTDLIIAVGEKAMEFVGRAQQPGERQEIQLMLGDRYLAKGDAHQAWKYFLAAAFNGDPRLDGIVRHELGRAYEALGRDRRAFSSYQRALSKFVDLPPEMQETARAGLERLRPKLDPGDPLLQGDRSGS